jgi:penicillin-binding protein 1A
VELKRQAKRIVGGLALGAALAVGSLLVYGAYLVQRLDLGRDEILRRAESAETRIVPAVVAGADGRSYDAHLSLPLHLPEQRVPDFVKDAFISSEDQQFRSWWHVGVNPFTVLRAAVADAGKLMRGERGKLVGGSTITMQLVKNLLLNSDQSIARKLNEMVLAVYVEALFSKDEILTMYLNNAYFGEGHYGVEAAAREYFGRSIGYDPQVSLFEAAMLARSVRRPSYVNPSSRRDLLEAEARRLLAAMAVEGYIDEATAQRAARMKARAPGEREWKLRPFLFRDLAMRGLFPRDLLSGSSPLVLGLTIQPEAQLYAERIAADLLKAGRKAGYDNSAVVVMEPDGAIVALATGRSYDDLKGFNLVADGRVSPGSTLKPFVFLCALEAGMRPHSRVTDARREFRPGWAPRNLDGRYLGRITLAKALALSRNPPAVALFDRFGPGCFDDVLRRFGVRLKNPRAPTAVLGSEPVSLLTLTAAYAAFANGGHRVAPYAVRYARTMGGALVHRHPTALGPKVAKSTQAFCDIAEMLRQVTSSRGTGRRAAFTHPVGGKTGTSNGSRDALFVGFTGRYVAAVWMGRQARGPIRRATAGGDLPAQAFRKLMATLHEGKPVVDIGCGTQVAAR